MNFFGWIDKPDEVKRMMDLMTDAELSDVIKSVPREDLPKQCYLWEAQKAVIGKVIDWWNQKSVGSCVGFGHTKACVTRQCYEIAVLKDPETYVEYAPEITYAGSREIGGMLGSGDGSIGAYAADFTNKFGLAPRGKYTTIDLTEYNESQCRKLGREGVPKEIIAICKKHPTLRVSRVKSWEDAKLCLAKGGAISICSSRGFRMERDSKGRCQPSGTWQHCMCLMGYHIETNLEMGFIDNSWDKNAHTGPLGPGDPPQSGFYSDANVIDRDILSSGDCWAVYDIEGIKKPYVPMDYIF